MDSTFIDIRFTNENSDKVYDHWIEYVEPGVRAVVYVEVDYLPFYGSKNIYWYYNNSEAEDISNPHNTMLYFDDFDSDTGWNQISETVSTEIIELADGTTVLHKFTSCGEDGAWKYLETSYPNFKLISKDFRSVKTQNDEACKLHVYGVETESYDGINFRRDGNNGTENLHGEIGLHTRANGDITNISTKNANQPKGNWYRTEVSYCLISLFNTNAQLWDNDMELIDNVYHFDYAMYDFDRITIRGGSPYMLDYIALAQKLCIEPYISYYEVEDCPQPTLISSTTDYCDDGNGEISFTIDGGVAPYEVCWFINNDSLGTIVVPASVDTITLDSLTQGIYTVRLKDHNGCEN